MQLSDAMKQDRRVDPVPGTVGRERPAWYTVATLRVDSGTLDVADLPGTGAVRVAVPNGLYLIEAKLIDFDGSLRLSRVRARIETTNPDMGAKQGMVAVDFGSIRIADFLAIQNGLTSQELQEFSELTCAFSKVSCDICRLNFESRSVYFVLCQSGFGDGTYPVSGLNRGAETVGLEVQFIKDGHVLGEDR